MSLSPNPATSRGPVALVTCAELPELDPDDVLLADALRERGITVAAPVWDDPDVDWDRYALAVVRSTWDYPERLAEFLRWADAVPRLANPAKLLRWNTDKTYLRELGAAGLPVVPTTWLEPGRPGAEDGLAALRQVGERVEHGKHGKCVEHGEYVVKPAVGAGSKDAGRYDLGAAEHRVLALAHARRLLDAGRTVMVQPYLGAVDTEGESALVHIGGAYSHAIRKGAMLAGPDTGFEGLYRSEIISPLTPTAAELALARRVLDALPSDEPPLYARVDLLRDSGGEPVLLEVELSEPSLFFSHAEGSAERMAEALARRLATR